MKKFTLILILTALSACAPKPDPGLEKPVAGFGVKDSLKGRSAAEVLRLKYSSAVAVCKMERVSAESGQAENQVTATAAEAEDEIKIDLKEWAEADSELKPVVKKVTNTADGQMVSVNLSLKLEIASLTFRQDQTVYVMKHSPQIVFSFTADSAHPGNGKNSGVILERVLAKTLVASSSVGEGNAAKKYSHMLACKIETTLRKDSRDLDEYEAQFQILDCSSPKEGQQKLAADFCKN